MTSVVIAVLLFCAACVVVYKNCFYDKVTPTSISLNYTELKLAVNDDYTPILTGKVYPSTASQKITWETSDASVVTVDSKGKINVCGVGDALVSGSTKNGIVAKCSVNVDRYTFRIQNQGDISYYKNEADYLALNNKTYTITLLEDYELENSYTVASGCDVTLNLRERTLSSNLDLEPMFTVNGKLTVGGNGFVKSKTRTFVNNGTLTLNDVRVESTNSTAVKVMNGTTNIDGATITAKSCVNIRKGNLNITSATMCPTSGLRVLNSSDINSTNDDYDGSHVVAILAQDDDVKININNDYTTNKFNVIYMPDNVPALTVYKSKDYTGDINVKGIKKVKYAPTYIDIAKVNNIAVSNNVVNSTVSGSTIFACSVNDEFDWPNSCTIVWEYAKVNDEGNFVWTSTSNIAGLEFAQDKVLKNELVVRSSVSLNLLVRAKLVSLADNKTVCLSGTFVLNIA